MSSTQYSSCPATSFRKPVGGYDPTHPLNKASFRACAFSRFTQGQSISILDAMSGPGLFGKTIQQLHSNASMPGLINLAFSDVRSEPMATLQSEGHEVIQSDIRALDISPTFNVAIERFGLKDLPMGHLELALERIRNALIPSSRIVIADMFSPTKNSQQGAILVHAAEQRFGGRVEETEGRCFIPTLEEWSMALERTGFKASVRFMRARGTLELSVFKGRFSQDPEDKSMLEYVNAAIVEACNIFPSFKTEFGVYISGRAEETVINWPYAVIVGEKK